MKRYVTSIFMAGLVAILLAGTPQLLAQQAGQQRPQRQQGERPQRGDFDPAQMRQRMMERYREVMEVKGDDEWKIIQERIEKVQDARREVGFGGMGGMMMMGRRPGGDAGGDTGQRRGPGAGAADPTMEALQKALESKASNEEIKTKLTAMRSARQAKEAALEKAQADLRQVLTVRQEAQAVMMGLLR